MLCLTAKLARLGYILQGFVHLSTFEFHCIIVFSFVFCISNSSSEELVHDGSQAAAGWILMFAVKAVPQWQEANKIKGKTKLRFSTTRKLLKKKQRGLEGGRLAVPSRSLIYVHLFVTTPPLLPPHVGASFRMPRGARGGVPTFYSPLFLFCNCGQLDCLQLECWWYGLDSPTHICLAGRVQHQQIERQAFPNCCFCSFLYVILTSKIKSWIVCDWLVDSTHQPTDKPLLERRLHQQSAIYHWSKFVWIVLWFNI